MAGLNEEARIPVYINDEQAKSALKNLTAEADKWRKAMYDAMHAPGGGDMKAVKDAETQLKKTNRQISELKREAFNVDAVLKKLSSASINDLNKTAAALKKQYNSVNQGTKESIELAKQYGAVKSRIAEVNGQLVQQQGVLGKLKNVAGGLLPAFGWGAIAAGATMAFNKIMSSTDTLSTKWAIFKGGLTEGMNEFWRTLGNPKAWGSFISNMQEAIRVGREYQAVLDEIEANQRSLTVAEADALTKIDELEEKARNKELSLDERIKAGNDRIKLEEDLAAMRSKIAEKAYANDLSLAMNASKLTKERIEELIRDYDSGLKAEAEAYIAMQQKLKSLERQASRSTTVSGPGTAYIRTDPENEKAQNELRANMAAVSSEAQRYAEDLLKLGDATDELLNKAVSSYKGMKEASHSAYQNTARIRTQVHSMIYQQTEKANQEDEKQLKEHIEIQKRHCR